MVENVIIENSNSTFLVIFKQCDMWVTFRFQSQRVKMSNMSHFISFALQKKYVRIFAPKINIYRPFLTSSTKYLNFRAKNETFGVYLIKSFLKNVESLIGRWCSCWCKSLIYGMAIGYQGDLSVKKSISSSICWNPFGNEVSLAYFFSNQNLISSVDHFNPFFRHKNSTVASKLRHVRNSCLNALFPSTQ